MYYSRDVGEKFMRRLQKQERCLYTASHCYPNWEIWAKGRVHVQHFHGTAETWDKWPTIRKANPLIGLDPHTRKVILEERDSAWSDPRLKARFCSYRLNIPSRDDSEMLLTVDDWERIKNREACEPDGAPIVAVDLGSSRSWSAACAVYPSGLIDAIAVAPGEPDLSVQEARDRVNPGTYQKLEEAGLLLLADGLRVAPPGLLWDAILERWGKPPDMVVSKASWLDRVSLTASTRRA